MTMPDPKWLEVLRAEASRPRVTKQSIANQLGISRTAVSLLIDGKYTAKTDKVSKKIANKVMALYADKVWCPHLRNELSPKACRHHATAPMSNSDPAKLKHWAACRTCSHNPVIFNENQKEGKDHAV